MRAQEYPRSARPNLEFLEYRVYLHTGLPLDLQIRLRMSLRLPLNLHSHASLVRFERLLLPLIPRAIRHCSSSARRVFRPQRTEERFLGDVA